MFFIENQTWTIGTRLSIKSISETASVLRRSFLTAVITADERSPQYSAQ